MLAEAMIAAIKQLVKDVSVRMSESLNLTELEEQRIVLETLDRLCTANIDAAREMAIYSPDYTHQLILLQVGIGSWLSLVHIKQMQAGR